MVMMIFGVGSVDVGVDNRDTGDTFRSRPYGYFFHNATWLYLNLPKCYLTHSSLNHHKCNSREPTYRKVPKSRTRRCWVTTGMEVMRRWMWSRCCSVSDSWMIENSSCSPSRPKMPSGSLRRNFLRTDAIVYTEKLSVGE